MLLFRVKWSCFIGGQLIVESQFWGLNLLHFAKTGPLLPRFIFSLFLFYCVRHHNCRLLNTLNARLAKRLANFFLAQPKK